MKINNVCQHSTGRPQAASGGDGQHIWTADKGWFCSTRDIATKGPERYAVTKDYENCIRGSFITVFLVPYSQADM